MFWLLVWQPQPIWNPISPIFYSFEGLDSIYSQRKYKFLKKN